MSVVANYTFDSDAEGFSAGSRTASEGADFDTGYLSVPTATTASKSHTAITSGVFRVSFFVRIADTDTASDATKNDFFYILPTSGAVSSANSITTIAISRNSMTSDIISLQRRDSSAFVEFIQPYRGGWFKISVVANFASATFNLYLNDVLWERNIAWANAAATDFSRVAVLAGASSPGITVDEIVIETSPTNPTESVLVDHTFVGGTGEIEDSAPTTNTRSINPQNWKIPDDTSNFGGFTLGANGAQPDASKECFALIRCVAQGIEEIEFQSSVAGVIDFGMMIRAWEGMNQGGAGYLRVRGGAINTIALFLPTATGTLTQVAVTALTPSANTTYTLKVEMRGREYACSYKAAAMDSGSYTVAFTHTVINSATGGRGLLSEEQGGPVIITSAGATDNYVRRYRFTGAVPAAEINPTVGGYQLNLAYGSVRELYFSGSGGATKNLFWSKGIQCGHRSRADMGNYVCQQQTIYNGTHVKAYRQRAQNTTEYQVLGESDVYFTLLRRGLWVSDRTTVGGTTENIAPDLDMHKIHFDSNYKVLAATGTSVSDLTDTGAGYHDWREDIGSSANAALPLSFQRLTAFGSGNQARITSTIGSNLNWSGSVHNLTHKMRGNGDPISQAVARYSANLVHATAYEVYRAYRLECASGLSLDSDTLIDWRDDYKTPAALSFTTGAIKTNAAGDLNTDGFNERHGWYEITCSGGTADFTVPVTSGSPRYYPAFRLHSWTNTNVALEIDGVAATPGTDYVIEDMGGSVGILQVLSVLTADTDLTLASSSASLLMFLVNKRGNRQALIGGRQG